MPGSGSFIKLWFTATSSGSGVIGIGTLNDWFTEARNRYHNFTPDFASITVLVGIRGDANEDGNVNVGDAVALNNVVFHEVPPPLLYQGDANADGMINVGDVVYLVNFIFNDGPPPPP